MSENATFGMIRPTGIIVYLSEADISILNKQHLRSLSGVQIDLVVY